MPVIFMARYSETVLNLRMAVFGAMVKNGLREFMETLSGAYPEYAGIFKYMEAEMIKIVDDAEARMRRGG